MRKYGLFCGMNLIVLPISGTPITHYVIEKAEGASTSWTLCGKVNGDQNKCHITGLRPEKDHRLQVRRN